MINTPDAAAAESTGAAEGGGVARRSAPSPEGGDPKRGIRGNTHFYVT